MGTALPSPFAKVRFSRAHENIVEQFQRVILTGGLKPGSRLPSERQLMTEFQVSRSTVREALRVAESMGLISVRPGAPSGSKVLCAPSIGVSRVLESLIGVGCASNVDLIELSALVQSSAAAMACAQPKEWVRPATELLRKMEGANEPREFTLLDIEFHQALAAASGNCLLLIASQALVESIFVLIENRLGYLVKDNREEILRHHAAIVDALASRNADLAANAMRKHILESYSTILSDRSIRQGTAERGSSLNLFCSTGLLPRCDELVRDPQMVQSINSSAEGRKSIGRIVV